MAIKCVGVEEVPVQVVKKQFSLIMDEEVVAHVVAALESVQDYVDCEDFEDANPPSALSHIKIDYQRVGEIRTELCNLVNGKKKR